MSALAKNLPKTVVAPRIRRGPSGECDVYGDGDVDDWRAVERLRSSATWAEVHREVDKALGITSPIITDKFRYHWKRRCWHWTQEQRNAPLEAGK
jgi:hypothetical protein